MWRGGSAKQRVRLGPSRHLCCSWRRYTNAHAHCYSDRHRHGHGHRQPDCHCYGDCHGDTQPHGHSIAIANGHGETDANTQNGAIGKAAPNACASAVEISSRQNFC